ncbi:unnamed protein product [Paramecium sonneborni]|uniref:Uncharacterized protein n=1 Tax=Paramecium sonneborni TaxID=65129 RepID=A0A8S1RMR0_9CILI|nr:unnamed protein product [Paramecium sonneborni]
MIQNNKLNSLVSLPNNYIFRDKVIEELQTLIRNGQLSEAKIDGLKGYNRDDKNLKATTLNLNNINKIWPTLIRFQTSSFGVDRFSQQIGRGQLCKNIWRTNLNTRSFIDQMYIEIIPIQSLLWGCSKQQRKRFKIQSFNLNLFNILLIYGHYLILINPPKLVFTETNFRKYQLLKYICQSEILNQQSQQQFIDDFRNKNLTEFYKSEPAPEYVENQHIYKIVGSKFSQEVLNRGKNVLLLEKTKSCLMIIFNISINSHLFKIGTKTRLLILILQQRTSKYNY